MCYTWCELMSMYFTWWWCWHWNTGRKYIVYTSGKLQLLFQFFSHVLPPTEHFVPSLSPILTQAKHDSCEPLPHSPRNSIGNDRKKQVRQVDWFRPRYHRQSLKFLGKRGREKRLNEEVLSVEEMRCASGYQKKGRFKGMWRREMKTIWSGLVGGMKEKDKKLWGWERCRDRESGEGRIFWSKTLFLLLLRVINQKNECFLQATTRKFRE
jgi:hypothetical protein